LNRTENSPRIVTAADVDRPALHAFLGGFYPPSKSEFLRAHGTWWHRGDENRWVMLIGQQIAGYCAIIPTRVLINGQTVPAIWWVDLVIAPEFRGHGLQTLFDEKVRKLDVLKLGFPNPLAARIHRKHGWGVRDDLRMFMLPLRLLNIKQVRTASGARRILLQAGASAIIPWAAGMRQRLKHYQPRTAHRLDDPSPDILSAVFDRYKQVDLTTTYRDADYFQWRFFAAPYRDELAFYLSGPARAPKHFLIARHLKTDGIALTRILDVFGDFSDEDGIRDIIRLALKDAALGGSSQVTILAAVPELRTLLRKQGFLLGNRARFCWIGNSPHLMGLLEGRSHWTLADSDNDEPV